MKGSLAPLLAPRSIAILGASENLARVNGRPLGFLLAKGYPGRVYPVNPKYRQIAGVRCYPSVEAIPDPVDLAIVALPAGAVAAALRSLGGKGVPAAVVFSSGFGEMGAEGAESERELVRIAAQSGLRICGPNCLGLINAFERVIATFGQFADGETPAGPVGFVTQSGAFGTAIAALARRRGLGLGYFVNTGNEADVGFAEVMREVISDERIRVGAGYIEGLTDGTSLVELARFALDIGKPLVLTKVGRSRAGERAAASHTGSLAGEDAVFGGIVHQFGIVRSRNEEHMLDQVEAFAHCALPAGRGLGIVTQSGGAGVLMADRAEDLGLEVPVLTESTQARLRSVIPAFGTTANPVDVTGQFIADPRLLEESVLIVLDDPGVHAGIVWLQLMDAHVDTLVGIFERIRARAAKPFVVCWVAASERALVALRERGIAVLRGAEPAVDAIAGLAEHALARRAWLEDAGSREAALPAAAELPAHSGLVPTLDAARLLTDAGITLASVRLARSAEEAVRAASELGYPVALKIESPDIAHKTDAGGVRLGLRDADEVARAWEAMMEGVRATRPKARIDGAILQPMIAEGIELVVGLRHDPVFGTIVMVGLGGILVEVLRDVAFRLAPVTEAEARAMLETLSGRSVLDGVRGTPAADRAAIARFVSAVSRFGAAVGPRLRELDLNPVRVHGSKVVALDCLLVLA